MLLLSRQMAVGRRKVGPQQPIFWLPSEAFVLLFNDCAEDLCTYPTLSYSSPARLVAVAGDTTLRYLAGDQPPGGWQQKGV